jgi:putative transposase
MICRDHDLAICRQASLLGISRGSVYYTPVPVPDEDLDMMRRMDALHLEHPWMGSRMLRDMLERQGVTVGRKHVATLMKRMGITALYKKPDTSKRHPGHKVYPYLLRGLNIDRADKVWAMDITYIPMKRGFVYLCAVVDWASRRVLSHRVSVTMDVSFCLEALEEAFSKYGKPDYFNTDQGSQFTSLAFTDALKEKGIQISMDGKGCWRDNVFVERIWKSLKYEEVYLHAYETVSDAKAGIAKYFRFYNSERPHSSLGKRTPDEFYFQTRSPIPAVA